MPDSKKAVSLVTRSRGKTRKTRRICATRSRIAIPITAGLLCGHDNVWMHCALQLFRRSLIVVFLMTASPITSARSDVLLSAPFITGSTRYAARDLVDTFASRIGQPVNRRLLDAISAE